MTQPGTLTAAALADAVAAIDATVVFASPAALRNVVADRAPTSTPAQRGALAGVRLLMSAGAPVPAALLDAVRGVLPRGRGAHPVRHDRGAAGHRRLRSTRSTPPGPGKGVCVGRPLPGVEVGGQPAVADGRRRRRRRPREPGVTGEICVARRRTSRTATTRCGPTERAAPATPGWHRTGDVGHLDAEGRLWVEGRLVHVITTADGVVTPVGVEQRVEALDGVAAAAVVGVGPAGHPAGGRRRGARAGDRGPARRRTAAGRRWR